MKIEIIENKNKPKFKKIDFLCDIPIHNKLDEMDVIKDHFNKASTTVIVGKQGSGKTSLLMNLMNIYKKCFGYIYVFMRETSRDSIKNNVFDKHLPPDQLFEDLTYEDIEDVYERLKLNTKEGYFSLLIFDDVQDALKDKAIVGVLNKIVANQRHLKAVNIFLLQNFYALSDKLRKLTNNLIFFSMDKVQLEQLFKNYIKIDKKDFEKICDYTFKNSHDWMLINLNAMRFYKGFDEIVCRE